jgi:hypothetical protein
MTKHVGIRSTGRLLLLVAYQPADALEFYTYRQIQELCLVQPPAGPLDTVAKIKAATLVGVSEQKCEAYLLGVVNGIQAGSAQALPRIYPGTRVSDVIDPIKRELTKPSSDPFGTSAMIRRVLQREFGCE